MIFMLSINILICWSPLGEVNCVLLKHIQKESERTALPAKLEARFSPSICKKSAREYLLHFGGVLRGTLQFIETDRLTIDDL